MPFVVSHSEHIAQLIYQQICSPILDEVKVLDKTERGESGFGSTDNN